MDKWNLVKQDWLIEFKPNYRSKIVTISNKKGEYFLCKIWFNEKKELTLVQLIDGISYLDENLIKNMVRKSGGVVSSYQGINLL